MPDGDRGFLAARTDLTIDRIVLQRRTHKRHLLPALSSPQIYFSVWTQVMRPVGFSSTSQSTRQPYRVCSPGSTVRNVTVPFLPPDLGDFVQHGPHRHRPQDHEAYEQRQPDPGQPAADDESHDKHGDAQDDEQQQDARHDYVRFAAVRD
jgi:hypothetical protein